MIVRMWEVRGYPERFDELLAWVCDTALPAVEPLPAYAGSEVLSSTDHRILILTRWRGNEPPPLPEPPSRLVSRPPHTWDFAPVDR